MCIGDGNPKPEVTITGLCNGNVTGKEVVELEVMEKKVLWCRDHHNSRVPAATRKLIGNAAAVVLRLFRIYKFLYWNGIKWELSYNTAQLMPLSVRTLRYAFTSAAVSYSVCVVDPSEFEGTQYVKGRLRVTDIGFDDEFSDKNSREYLVFTGRFVEQVGLEHFLVRFSSIEWN